MKLNFASCTFTHSIKAMSCVAALFLGLLGVAPSSSATVLTATDSSWKVTASLPGASGWNSNAAFDDSGWASATELSTWPGYVAKVIWSTGGQFSTSETQIWARSIFNLSALPLSAVLNNGFDDDGDIYVNGTSVVWAVEGSPAYHAPCNVGVGLRELNPTYPNTPAG